MQRSRTPAVTKFVFGHEVAIVAISGHCAGPACCERVAAAVAEAVESQRIAIVIDLREVDAIGADVVRLIADIHGAAAALGWEMAIVSPAGGPSRGAFRRAGDDAALRVFSTRAFAILAVMASRAAARRPAFG